MVYSMRASYLGISSILLLVEGIFLPLFWIAHEHNSRPGSLGVYSLFGIDHPPHNVFFVPNNSALVILLFTVPNSFIILRYYRHGRKWSWYVLLLAYLALIFPPTIGAAISRGIGAEYYLEARLGLFGGTLGPFYNQVSLRGVIIPWILFIPGILLGSGIVLGSKPKSYGPTS